MWAVSARFARIEQVFGEVVERLCNSSEEMVNAKNAKKTEWPSRRGRSLRSDDQAMERPAVPARW